jgi:orotate phosphoribosyltransferase
MLNQAEILDILKSIGAIKEGHFRYTSGLHGKVYVQCATLLKDPALAGKVCAGIAEHFRSYSPDLVLGPAVGAVNLSYEVARQLGVPSLFAERNDESKMILRRSFEILPGQKVLVVEDVITTGGTTREMLDLVQSLGGEVIGAASIVNRSRGKAMLPVPYFALLDLDVENYPPEQCPLCQAGIPVEKPGSRKIHES